MKPLLSGSRFCQSIVLAFSLAACATAPEAKQLAADYYYIGNAFFEMGQYQKALDMYRRSLALFPGFLEGSYSAARAYVALGEHAEGIRLLKELLKVDRNNVLILSTLAYAHAGKGDLSNAEDYYRQAAAISPGNLNAWYNLGLIRLAADDLAGAEANLRTAYTLEPANMQVLGHLARVLHDLGRRGEAIQFYELQRAGAPGNVESMRRLAGLYYEEKYYVKALGVLEELVKSGEVQAGDFFQKARVHLVASRELDQGLAALDQALEKKFADRKKLLELLAEVPVDFQTPLRNLYEKRSLSLEQDGR